MSADIKSAREENNMRCNLERPLLEVLYGCRGSANRAVALSLLKSNLKDTNGPEAMYLAGNENFNLLVRLLEEKGLIGAQDGILALTTLGYAKFDAWHKKAWRFFTNDMAKVLSLVATALSIISMIVALSPKNGS